MKKIISGLCIFFCICLLIPSFVAPSLAFDEIDVDRPSSLTFVYERDGNAYEGLEIKTFYFASVDEYGNYTLAGDFTKYPVDISKIKDQASWRSVSTTLAAYAVADGLTPTYTAVTDEFGTVMFDNVLPGMYLTLSVRAEKNGEVTYFGSFATGIPTPNIDGTYNYNIRAVTKRMVYFPSTDIVEYRVIKLWRDAGMEDERPFAVVVDILKDGVLQETEVLSPENNWAYSWNTPDDGAQWTVVERDVPDGYSVTIEENTTSFLITNTAEEKDDEEGENPPGNSQTGDMNFLPYILVMCLAGTMFIILAVWRKKKDSESENSKENE